MAVGPVGWDNVGLFAVVAECGGAGRGAGGDGVDVDVEF